MPLISIGLSKLENSLITESYFQKEDIAERKCVNCEEASHTNSIAIMNKVPDILPIQIVRQTVQLNKLDDKVDLSEDKSGKVDGVWGEGRL
ncbi:MAG: hypothetical protein M1834_003537 [Cirrosporium novae-zelandiae]|nr:MAG: hypothetical protein M1834_003537 [Cirrosporium novae-zelandiae]